MTRRLLIRDACLADGHSPTLQVGVSLLMENQVMPMCSTVAARPSCPLSSMLTVT
jgi:hypothetical protein